MRSKLEQLRTAIEKLDAGVETRVYVDTGPVVERAFARLSGMGWMGKNTCLINEGKGSWFFLGVILTSLELAPDLPAPDRCGSCTRCLEACPTGALVEPYVMDASRCIAYLNIELKGAIPEHFREAIGNNVVGCDICQDVCPWNSPPRAAVSSLPEFQPAALPQATGSELSRFSAAAETGQEDEPSLFTPSLQALASFTEEDFKKFFARSPIKRVKYRGWLRNICVAMGNSNNPRFIPWLESAAAHPDPMLREHAAWALRRLQAEC
jgi:epoxyqueuosine reductase